ncbi:MAG: hypothetical protein WAL25_13830 [Acidimicrobiia bacterium]
MTGTPKFTDLVAEAVSGHGKATADLLRRIGRGEDVDYIAEASNCLADVTRTASRFLLFWDNIATLLAEDPGGPLTFPAASTCAEGEKQEFDLHLQSAGPPILQSGLRRRGDQKQSIEAGLIAASTGPKGQVVVVVDCSGQPRGVYEGSMLVVDVNGNQTTHPYNVYINPGAQA